VTLQPLRFPAIDADAQAGDPRREPREAHGSDQPAVAAQHRHMDEQATLLALAAILQVAADAQRAVSEFLRLHRLAARIGRRTLERVQRRRVVEGQLAQQHPRRFELRQPGGLQLGAGRAPRAPPGP
jgi:hypothetical protein